MAFQAPQDIVIVPTYDRPEMLWLCLEYLSRCSGIKSVQIRIYVDAHIGQPSMREEVAEVLDKFTHLSIQVGYRYAHQFSGNSFNVLMAYKDAFETESKYVFLVEDDVLVRPEFLAWHRLLHMNQALGCSIAVAKEPQFGPYVSLGVGFRREMLALIVPHCRMRYFQNMRAYCRMTFPPSRLDCEQDGLWARVLVGQEVAWALEPLAQHVGWYGYHRQKSIRPQGSLTERYHQVKYTLTNNVILQAWSRDFNDILPLRSPTVE